MRSRRIAGLAVIGLVWAVGAMAAPVEILPVAQIEPGMVGEGYTVFSGEEIESFKATIMGVLHNYGPKQNLILAMLEGGPLAETGVIAGMSGSPVYIDGKLIGAVAFSFPVSKEPIAGITPIEEMIDSTATPARRSRAARVSFPLVPEKLDAQRVGLRVRENVDDAAAAGEITGHLDLVAFHETACVEPRDQRIRVDRLPDLQCEGLCGNRCR